MRKIWIIGAAISLTLILGACSSQIQAETTPTTIEATTVVETTVTETTTAIETTEASNDKYGEFGKEMYDILVSDWMEWLYADEAELRLNATAMLGSISEENYEAIIQEILAMDRGENPYASTQAAALGLSDHQESSVPETVPETQTQVGTSSKPVENAAQQPVTEPQSVAETQSQPEVQPTESARADGLAPGALTIEEIERRKAEAGIGHHAEGEIGGEIHLDPDAGQGYNWQ